MRTLRGYLLFGPLAAGGMASVHLGCIRAEGGFSRLIAIKTMHAHLGSDPVSRRMFLDEARIVGRIHHRNVVGTLDVFEESGELYQVMEYVNGPALGSLLHALASRSEDVPVGVAIAILVDVLEGLHAAHEAEGPDGMPLGVVHRDVSAQNVIVGEDGSARVVDFGIATARDRSDLTSPGEVKGKAAYMAPEQAQGAGVDRRADIYAAGVLLFEVLTKTLPFEGSGFVEVATQHVLSPPPMLRERRPDLPPALEAVVSRALEKAPAERFSTARDMANALEGLDLKAPAAFVAEWIGEEAREFFRERAALVQASWRDAARRADEAPSSPSDADRGAPPGALRKGARTLLASLLGMVVLATLFFAVVRRALPASPLRTTVQMPPGPGPMKEGHIEPAPSIQAAVPSVAAAAPPPSSAAPVALPRRVTSLPARALRPAVEAPFTAERPQPSPRRETAACCRAGVRVRFVDCDEATCSGSP